MIYVIENDKLKVEINTLGAEPQSIIGKKTGFEYLWQGNAEYWGGRSTVLFPICGRLYEGKYTVNGNIYEMELHGIVRKREFTVESVSDTKIVLTFKSNEETKKIYPFDFEFKMTYALDGNKFTNGFTVINKSKEKLPFSYGGHPGFNLPFNGEGKFEDYYVEFEKKKDFRFLEFSENKLCTGNTLALELENGNKLNLRHDLFDNDAIFVIDNENQVTLKSDKSLSSVKVKYQNTTHLGFWHKPFSDAPYVCIEPWHGSPAIDGKTDDFMTKNDMIIIGEGKTYENSYDIIVEE
jgi:galactose mutarotase-like enzyme